MISVLRNLARNGFEIEILWPADYAATVTVGPHQFPVAFAEPISPPVVTAVAIHPAAATVARGGSLTLAYDVQGRGRPPAGVIWSLEGNQHEGTTIYYGTLTVSFGEPSDTLTVRATSEHDPGAYAVSEITLTGAITTIWW